MLTATEFREAVPNPINIVRELDKYVIGQEDAKKTLALMVLNRAIRKLMRNKKINVDTYFQKNNVLLIGPTGTGKNALMNALSKVIGVPISTHDVTEITSAGYIGGKVEDILVRHATMIEDHVYKSWSAEIGSYFNDIGMSQFDYLKECVETGIIYIDEIDKARRRGYQGGYDGDINGDSIQNELLKVLEAGNISLSVSRLHLPKCGITSLLTDDITFVLGGAFSGLDKIIKERCIKKAGIGFNSELITKDTNILDKMTIPDLETYGFKSEFLGRIPLKTTLNPMTANILTRIMVEPKDCIFKQYYEFFKLFGIELKIDSKALNLLATRALELNSGARALKAVFAALLESDIYNIFNATKETLDITKHKVINMKL